MKRINTMESFLKVDATKRWGVETSPVASPAESAALELQEMVRKVNLVHKPITVERFLDLARYIRELVLTDSGITTALAAELTWILTREWERPWPLTPRPYQRHTFKRGGKVGHGRA